MKRYKNKEPEIQEARARQHALPAPTKGIHKDLKDTNTQKKEMYCLLLLGQK
jgi:hypothetical protein